MHLGLIFFSLWILFYEGNDIERIKKYVASRFLAVFKGWKNV